MLQKQAADFQVSIFKEREERLIEKHQREIQKLSRQHEEEMAQRIGEVIINTQQQDIASRPIAAPAVPLDDPSPRPSDVGDDEERARSHSQTRRKSISIKSKRKNSLSESTVGIPAVPPSGSAKKFKNTCKFFKLLVDQGQSIAPAVARESLMSYEWLLKFICEFYIRVSEYVTCGAARLSASSARSQSSSESDEVLDTGVSGWKVLGTGWSAGDIVPLDMSEIVFAVLLVVDNDGSKSVALKVSDVGVFVKN